MATTVKIYKCKNFIYGGASVRYLGKPLVGKPLKAAFFVTINVAAKGTITK
jgi:hypothetical protein